MNKTALITGASSGIGYELSKLFAKDKYDLVIIARNLAELEKVARELRDSSGINVYVIAKDLSNASAPQEIFDELKSQSLQIDILVNNAGFATYGNFASNDMAAELSELQVNIIALTHLTKLFLPGMIERRNGKVLNVASIAAFLPGPLMATYYASKAYVLSFSIALANEVKDSGVTVTALCPGPTATNFAKRASLYETKLFKTGLMSAEKVAEIGYKGMNMGKTIVIPGWINKVGAFLSRIFPRTLAAQITRMSQEG